LHDIIVPLVERLDLDYSDASNTFTDASKEKRKPAKNEEQPIKDEELLTYRMLHDW